MSCSLPVTPLYCHWPTVVFDLPHPGTPQVIKTDLRFKRHSGNGAVKRGICHGDWAFHECDDETSSQMVYWKHKKTGVANLATPVSCVIQEIKTRNQLLDSTALRWFPCRSWCPRLPKVRMDFRGLRHLPSRAHRRCHDHKQRDSDHQPQSSR